MPNGRSHAFLWDESQGMIDIVGPNGPSSEATAINDAGQVVGSVFKSETNYYAAFLWTSQAGMQELKIPAAESNAHKINNAGQIIGHLRTKKFLFFQEKEYHFLRTRSGRIINLDGYTNSEDEQIIAADINDHGWIVGQLNNSKKNILRPILLRPK